MIYQVGACLTYILQWVANVALPIFNRSSIKVFEESIATESSSDTAALTSGLTVGDMSVDEGGGYKSE